VAFAVGDLHIGVRSNHAALAAVVRRALAAHLVDDVEAPPNYSVALGDAHDMGDPFHFLYRGSTRIVRTRDANRLVRALLNHLSGHGVVADDELRVFGVGLVGARGALIGPYALRQHRDQLERRLTSAGVRFCDTELVHVDWRRREVVMSEPRLEVDWSALEALPSITPTTASDPMVGPGRYPLIGWAFLGEGDAPSRARAVALATRLLSIGSVSTAEELQRMLDALAHLMRSITPFRLAWVKPARLAAPLIEMM
jgi:hypothetical protein